MCCSGGIHGTFRWPRTFRTALHHEPSNGNDDLSKEVCLAGPGALDRVEPVQLQLEGPAETERHAVALILLTHK